MESNLIDKEEQEINGDKEEMQDADEMKDLYVEMYGA